MRRANAKYPKSLQGDSKTASQMSPDGHLEDKIEGF